MKTEQSSLNRIEKTVDLNHHKFMQMADQVMAELNKIGSILAKCLGDTRDQNKAA